MSGGIYLFVAMLIICYGAIFLPQKMDEKDRKRLLRFAFVLMVLLLGCRDAIHSYSSDVNNYYRMFDTAIRSHNLNSFLDVYSVEKGYLIFNWLLARVIRWPQAILFVHAIICTYFTFRFIDKHSDDLVMTLLCYMTFGGFLFYSTAFRQGIAISLCLFAIEFAEKKKFIKFCLIVLLACSIHQTAAVFFPVYFMLNFGVNKLTAFLDVCITAVIAVSSRWLVNLGNELLDMEYGQTKYGGTFLGGIINIVIGVFVATMMFFGMSNYIQIKLKRESIGESLDSEDKANINYKYFHILVLGIGLYTLRFSVLSLERVSFYFFTPMLYVLFPQVVNKNFKKGEDDVIRMLVYALLLFLLFWRYRDIKYSFFLS